MVHNVERGSERIVVSDSQLLRPPHKKHISYSRLPRSNAQQALELEGSHSSSTGLMASSAYRDLQRSSYFFDTRACMQSLLARQACSCFSAGGGEKKRKELKIKNKIKNSPDLLDRNGQQKAKMTTPDSRGERPRTVQ